MTTMAELQTLREIREATSTGVSMTWTWDERWRTDPARLHHLIPPIGPDLPAVRAWRDAYRYGLFYWRHGPGFALVKDARPASAARHTIDDPDLLACFQSAQDGIELGACSAVQREAASILADAGILTVVDGVALVLPYRMRRWPIPFTAV